MEHSGTSAATRKSEILDVLNQAFSDLLTAQPDAFRKKFRKMAAGPFQFYRGSAPLFYYDIAKCTDPFANEHTSRVWIQGDLHAENFGTYMSSEGVLTFDINDFDEAYLGHFTWDIKRFAASLGVLGWSKAFSDDTIRRLIRIYAKAYVEQIYNFSGTDLDHQFALRIENTRGLVRELLINTRLNTRIALLDRLTYIDDTLERRLRINPGVRSLGAEEKKVVEDAFRNYLDTIPESKRFKPGCYRIKDIAANVGFGIGSCGLPAYTILMEGATHALESDVILSMKQANIAAPSRVVNDERVKTYFQHHGHRTALSQRALQDHHDPWLGYTSISGIGFVVSELSPYTEDLDWGEVKDASDMEETLVYLGQATAKIHCVSDEDVDNGIIAFQVEDKISEALKEREDHFLEHIVEFGMSYSQTVFADYVLFVDAFREGLIAGI